MTAPAKNMYLSATDSQFNTTNLTTEIPNLQQAEGMLNLSLGSITSGKYGTFTEPVVIQLIAVDRARPLQPRLLELYLCTPPKDQDPELARRFQTNIMTVFQQTKRALQLPPTTLAPQPTQNTFGGLASCLFPW